MRAQLRVIVSGQSGLDKRNFLNRVRQLCNDKHTNVVDQSVSLNEKELKDSRIDCVFDLEHEFQQKRQVKNYLDLNESEFIEGKNKLLKYLNELYSADKHVIVAMHFTYFRKRSFYHRLEWNSLRAFSPDLIITLIDDVHKIHSVIRKRDDPDDYVKAVTLRDILVWREVEIMISETVAQNLYEKRTIPHYIVSLSQGPQIICQLMFEKKKKVYASYPITSTKEAKIDQGEIDKFVAMLKKYFIVFDPYTIHEKMFHDIIVQQLSGPLPRASESIKVDGEEYSIEDLLHIILDVNGQIITRDERLIQRADAVIAYRPSLSQGASHELTYAEMAGKEIIVYHPRTDDPSPFGFQGGGTQK